MSKTQDGFLGKVSKGIKKSIYDDEPDATSGKLIIERLQSLAGTASPGQSKKTVESRPEAVGAVNAQDPPPIAAYAAPTPVDTGYRTAETSVVPAVAPEQHGDAARAGEPTVVEETDPIRTSGPMATILVVEDEIVTQRLTRKILEERGY